MLGISISGDKDQSWMVNMKISRAEWYGTLGGESLRLVEQKEC